MICNTNIFNAMFYPHNESYTYLPVTTRDVRPIDLSDLKSHLKIDFLDPTYDQETYLKFLIDAVIDAAERYTNRIFINQQWKTFRNYLDEYITLERGQLASINSFKYKNLSGILTTIDPLSYYVAVKDPYSQIIRNDGFSYPSDIINQENSVEIVFTAGYGTTKESVPASLRLILMQHIVWLYENKGNCVVTDMPSIIKNAYDKHFKILSI